MKRVFYSIALMLFAMISLVSCESNPQDMIIGTFAIADITSDQKMDEATKEVWNAAMEDLKNNSSLTIREDRSFESTQNGITKRGTWELLLGDKQLSFEYEGRAKVINEIKELSADGFVLIQPDESGSTTIITYKKQN